MENSVEQEENERFKRHVERIREDQYREVKRSTSLNDLTQALAGKNAGDILPEATLKKGRRFVEEVVKAISTFGDVTDEDTLTSIGAWLLMEMLSRDGWTIGAFIDRDVRVAVLVYLGKKYVG